MASKDLDTLASLASYPLYIGFKDGGISIDTAQELTALGRDRIFTPEMLENICFFHLRGGMDYRNMRPVHKAMMAMLKKMLLKRPESERSTEEKGLLAAYDRPVDFTDRAALAPLIAWCRDEA